MPRAWLQLFRIALGPSIAWDVLVGWGLWRMAGQGQGMGSLPGALGVVLLAYHGGMALNDWADRRIDSDAGRRRPLVLGNLNPSAVLAAGLSMVVGSALLATWVLPHALAPACILVGVVLAYDFGGSPIRIFLGPILLATARVLAFHMAALGEAEWGTVLSHVGLVPGAALAFWWLFLSRLASYEETGAPRMHILAFPAVLSLVPLMVSKQAGGNPLFYGLWAGLGLWLLIPAWRDRHRGQDPAAVQAAVRRALVCSPLIPGALLLSAGAAPAWVAVGLGVVVLSVHGLARIFPPE